MATTPPSMHPTTRRLLGMLLLLCGGLMGLGLLIRVVTGAYSWAGGSFQSPAALLLSVNLVGLLASGLLMRWGLRLRRGDSPRRDPNADEIL